MIVDLSRLRVRFVIGSDASGVNFRETLGDPSAPIDIEVYTDGREPVGAVLQRVVQFCVAHGINLETGKRPLPQGAIT